MSDNEPYLNPKEFRARHDRRNYEQIAEITEERFIGTALTAALSTSD